MATRMLLNMGVVTLTWLKLPTLCCTMQQLPKRVCQDRHLNEHPGEENTIGTQSFDKLLDHLSHKLRVLMLYTPCAVIHDAVNTYYATSVINARLQKVESVDVEFDGIAGCSLGPLVLSDEVRVLRERSAHSHETLCN